MLIHRWPASCKTSRQTQAGKLPEATFHHHGLNPYVKNILTLLLLGMLEIASCNDLKISYMFETGIPHRLDWFTYFQNGMGSPVSARGLLRALGKAPKRAPEVRLEVCANCHAQWICLIYAAFFQVSTVLPSQVTPGHSGRPEATVEDQKKARRAEQMAFSRSLEVAADSENRNHVDSDSDASWSPPA